MVTLQQHGRIVCGHWWRHQPLLPARRSRPGSHLAGASNSVERNRPRHRRHKQPIRRHRRSTRGNEPRAQPRIRTDPHHIVLHQRRRHLHLGHRPIELRHPLPENRLHNLNALTLANQHNSDHTPKQETHTPQASTRKRTPSPAPYDSRSPTGTHPPPTSASPSTPPTLTGTQNWTKLTISQQAPTGTAYIRLEMRLTGPGTAWYDDLTLTTP